MLISSKVYAFSAWVQLAQHLYHITEHWLPLFTLPKFHFATRSSGLAKFICTSIGPTPLEYIADNTLIKWIVESTFIPEISIFASIHLFVG